MDSSGNFRPIPLEIAEQLAKPPDKDAAMLTQLHDRHADDAEALAAAAEEAGLPIFTNGEAIKIKGRWFVVKKVRKRMMHLKGMPSDWLPNDGRPIVVAETERK